MNDLTLAQQEIRRLQSIVRTQERVVMDMLVNFEAYFDREKCIKIFGSWMGDHLWSKFNMHDRNLIAWYRNLDDKNRQILCDYLHEHY